MLLRNKMLALLTTFFVLFVLPGFSQTFTLESVKAYPFPTELCASAKGSKIAWALDEQGKRNVYVAEGPEFKPRKLTNYNQDDGQEITSLSVSADGKWVVFVRGGDHGSNWEAGLPVNPAFSASPYKVQLISIPFAGGEPKSLSEGDAPAISPNSDVLAFIKGGQAWSVSIDGSVPAKSLFTTRGTVGSLQWSPNGSKLAFVAARADHSLIGIYTNESSPIHWIAPSFSHDASPRWSPDGTQLAFVRRPGSGGSPDSMLGRQHQPWSIYTANEADEKATLIWKAPRTLAGSIPSTHGGTNLSWAAGNRIVFLSYQDGWPHLYSIASTGGKEMLLTPGNFMAEHITLTPDKQWLVFSANTGNDGLDIERRHAVRVHVNKPGIEMLSQGSGLEWTPVITGDGNHAVFISATAQRPPVPAVLSLNNKSTPFTLIGADLIPNNFPQDKLVTPKQVIFKSADGITVHADLFEPVGGSAKKPAIVYVHGGPPRQMLLGWHYSDYYSNAYAMNQHLANLGFVVLSVNYRLGIGYGYAFHQPVNGGMAGAAEYLDVKAAGEWLQKQTNVDAKRIGIYGGSYGGFLTALALARDSKLFAAGVDLHGVHDWGTARSIMTAFSDKYEKAPDYDKAVQTAWRSSPVSSIAGWTSPVLIIHGDDDRNVRFNQSTDLVRRLEKKGVPMETLMIVDDTHHWMKHSNAIKIGTATADFFMRKLKK